MEGARSLFLEYFFLAKSGGGTMHSPRGKRGAYFLGLRAFRNFGRLRGASDEGVLPGIGPFPRVAGLEVENLLYDS